MSGFTRVQVAFSLIVVLVTVPAEALHFPEGCRVPGGVVTEIRGLDSEKATMIGKHTVPDIIWSCTQGHVHQGTMEPTECIEFYKAEGPLDDYVLSAQANCQKGAITVNDNLTVFPVSPACANGGFQAIEAFELLCPNSDLKLRLTD